MFEKKAPGVWFLSNIITDCFLIGPHYSSGLRREDNSALFMKVKKKNFHWTKSHVSVFLKHGGNIQLHVSVMFTFCGNVKIQVYVIPSRFRNGNAKSRFRHF